MPTTHTAQHLNSRHHQHGTQVTDRDGDTWTRVKTSHGTYWEHDGSRCRNLPKLYEPYTYKTPSWQDAYREELAKAVDAYLNAEKLHGQGTTNHPQPRSRGLFQTIPSTWTKPTNLLPTTTKTPMPNWQKLYSHYKNLGQTNPQPLTKNIHLPHATNPTTNDTTDATPQNDPINPNHYKGFSNNSEVIDITENLTFNTGNATKYLTRAGRTDGHNKGEIIQDLEKAIWYTQREIQRLTTKD